MYISYKAVQRSVSVLLALLLMLAFGHTTWASASLEEVPRIEDGNQSNTSDLATSHEESEETYMPIHSRIPSGLTAYSSACTSLTQQYQSGEVLPALAQEQVAVAFTISNQSVEGINGIVLYGAVPQGASLRSIEAPSGQIIYAKTGNVMAKKLNPTIILAAQVSKSAEATAFLVSFPSATLPAGKKLTVTAYFMLQNGTVSHDFMVEAQTATGGSFALTGTGVSYSTDAYSVRYNASQEARYEQIGNAAGVLRADGTAVFTLSKKQPTQQNYEFTGWNTQANGSGSNFQAGEKVLLTRGTLQHIVLYPQWRSMVYSVNYDYRGGTIDPVLGQSSRVVDGGKARQPSTSKAGQTLQGWYYTKNGIQTVWNFSTDTIVEPTVLYAKWTATPAGNGTVIFNGNGGTVSPSSQSVAVGSKLTEPTVHRENYIFTGWVRPNGTVWNFATDVMPSATITLTATWQFKATGALQTVTFATGKDSYIPAAQYIKQGNPVAKPQDPRKVGFVFTGWRRVGDTSNWNFEAPLTEVYFQTAFVLEAQWVSITVHPVTVLFYPEGGGPAPEKQVVAPGSLVLAPTAVTRDGYHFRGWYTGINPNFNTKWDFATTGVTPNETGKVILYAIWSKEPDYTGTNRKDKGLTILSERSKENTIDNGYGTGEPMPEDPWDTAPEDEKPLVPTTEPPLPGGQKPPSTLPGGNPGTGGSQPTEVKKPDPPKTTAPKTREQEKLNAHNETVEQAKETIESVFPGETAEEINMVWLAVGIVFAAVLILILGLVRRSKDE